MSQQRLKVLELLSAGKIDAAQAARLLQSLAKATPEVVVDEPEQAAFADELAGLKVRIGTKTVEEEPASEPKADTPATKLRIRVQDNTGKQRANIGIPFALLKFGVSIGERFAPELGEWDWNNLDIDVEDGDGHVRIFVE